MPKIYKKIRFLQDKWFRLAVLILIKSFQAYQPVRFCGWQLWPGRRDFEHRWTLIRREVEDCGAQSLLDIGCAEGYFVRRAARELGCFSLGIEGDVRRVTVAQNISTLDGNERAGFMYGRVDAASLSQFPSFDVVLFLSVLHHFKRAHGTDYCRDILTTIRSKTNKVLIFDMGIESEKSGWTTDRTKKNPATGEEATAWVAELIRSAGFSQVDLIGHATACRGRVARPIFRAVP